MSDIFLSYDRKDRVKAQMIAQALEKQGWKVFWDHEILPGKSWDKVIEEKLGVSKCVVVLWSKESIESDWVKEEAEEGRSVLVPALIDNVKPPLGFRRVQAANLVDWKGAHDHAGFALLLQSIAGILGTPLEPEDKNHILVEKVKENHKNGKERKTITNSIGMKFALISEGDFMMGSKEFDYAKPVHKVTISNPFYLGIYPVTQREWEAVMGDNPSHFKGDDLPVENVSWDKVQKFIKKLNEKEGIHKYRLPSEAEWEYTARAGTTTRYSFGDDESELGDYSWYSNNSEGKTHPVGQKNPNPWDLYDMHGNVWEWVQDMWHEGYDGAPTDGSAWEKGGDDRVDRGGSWRDDASRYRSASRGSGVPGSPSYVLGFRLLREL